jgi:hypothetical protein
VNNRYFMLLCGFLLSVSGPVLADTKVFFDFVSEDGYKTKFWLDGCVLNKTLYRLGRNYEVAARVDVNDVNCSIRRSDGLVESISCGTANEAERVQTTTKKDNSVEALSLSYLVAGVPKNTTERKASQIISTINAKKKSCGGESVAVADSYPSGKIVSVMVWGEGKQYGFTGEVISPVGGRKYKVMIKNILGGGTHLNPSVCSENRFIEKYKDEGRILTIPGSCFK